MSVYCECCVLSGRGLCDGPITRPEESCGVTECDREGCWGMEKASSLLFDGDWGFFSQR